MGSKLDGLKKKVAKKKAQKQRRRSQPKTRLSTEAKHQLFVSEWFRNDLNVAEAYRALSPRSKQQSLLVNGSRMLADPRVVKLVRAEMEKRRQKWQVEEEAVFRAWVAMADANVFDYFEVNGEELALKNIEAMERVRQQNVRKIKVSTTVSGSGDDQRRTQRVELEIVDRMKAVEMIAKHLGLFDTDDDDNKGIDYADLIRTRMARVGQTYDQS